MTFKGFRSDMGLYIKEISKIYCNGVIILYLRRLILSILTVVTYFLIQVKGFTVDFTNTVLMKLKLQLFLHLNGLRVLTQKTESPNIP